MRYCIINRDDELSAQLTEQFHKQAEAHDMDEDLMFPEVVLSIGGDGTMLHAFHTFSSQLDKISFVGIHTGHLGFYADWQPSEIGELILAMANTIDFHTVKYPVVEIQIVTENSTETHLTLNEFTLKGVDATLVAQLTINNENFEMFRGDGICISSPTGSTAYNKSLGGAMLHPSLEALQIAEIASINNRIYRTLGSSMILPKHHHCDIYPRANQNILLTLDHLVFERNDIVSIRSKVADQKVSFARYRPFPFWNRVRDAFIGLEVK